MTSPSAGEGSEMWLTAWESQGKWTSWHSILCGEIVRTTWMQHAAVKIWQISWRTLNSAMLLFPVVRKPEAIIWSVFSHFGHHCFWMIVMICQFRRKLFKRQQSSLRYSDVGRRARGLDEINETTLRAVSQWRTQTAVTPVHLDRMGWYENESDVLWVEF